jgi:HSP20 family molecular chaperone IbpA
VKENAMVTNADPGMSARHRAQVDSPALVPPVDVVEDASGITLYADLPGVPKDKLDIRVDGETLIIEGETALEIPRDMEATHVEVSVPRYRRVFALSRDLDTGNMTAELKHGVLKLRIQKAERARPRRIEVRGE